MSISHAQMQTCIYFLNGHVPDKTEIASYPLDSLRPAGLCLV